MRESEACPSSLLPTKYQLLLWKTTAYLLRGRLFSLHEHDLPRISRLHTGRYLVGYDRLCGRADHAYDECRKLREILVPFRARQIPPSKAKTLRIHRSPLGPQAAWTL